MIDDHQAATIIATAILESCGEHADHVMGPEEAKIIAKCILTALGDAGLQITMIEP